MHRLPSGHHRQTGDCPDVQTQIEINMGHRPIMKMLGPGITENGEQQSSITENVSSASTTSTRE